MPAPHDSFLVMKVGAVALALILVGGVVGYEYIIHPRPVVQAERPIPIQHLELQKETAFVPAENHAVIAQSVDATLASADIGLEDISTVVQQICGATLTEEQAHDRVISVVAHTGISMDEFSTVVASAGTDIEGKFVAAFGEEKAARARALLCGKPLPESPALITKQKFSSAGATVQKALASNDVDANDVGTYLTTLCQKKFTSAEAYTQVARLAIQLGLSTAEIQVIVASIEKGQSIESIIAESGKNIDYALVKTSICQ